MSFHYLTGVYAFSCGLSTCFIRIWMNEWMYIHTLNVQKLLYVFTVQTNRTKTERHTVAHSWPSSTCRSKSFDWSVAFPGEQSSNNCPRTHSRAWLNISWTRKLMTGDCMSTLGAFWKLSRRKRKTPADDRKSVADDSRPETVCRFYHIMFTIHFVIGFIVSYFFICNFLFV